MIALWQANLKIIVLKYVSGSDLFLEIFYSTFGVALSPLAGAAAAAAAAGGGDATDAGAAAPVCVIGTTRSTS